VKKRFARFVAYRVLPIWSAKIDLVALSMIGMIVAT